MINIINPQSNLLGPRLYCLSLVLALLEFSFETVDCFNIIICLIFCSREYGRNDMRCTSR